ncbi:hypothetical protein THAOC_00989, partial [Thalassiosira oceanica]
MIFHNSCILAIAALASSDAFFIPQSSSTRAISNTAAKSSAKSIEITLYSKEEADQLQTKNQLISSLSTELEYRNEDVNALIAELQRLQAVQESIEKDAEIASSAIQTLERDLAEEVAKHESDIVRMSQLLKEKEDHITQLNTASDESRAAIGDLEIQLAKNREEMLQVEASSAEKAGSLERVQSELAGLRSQYESKLNALEDLAEKVAKYESENVRLSQ